MNEYFIAMYGDEDTIEHHGILGQKWGVRRYQNYDGTLIKSGNSSLKKSKYTNIDGSLNEEGKFHAQKYIGKEINKNNKYYDSHIKKYKKLAESTDDPDMKKKFESMIKDAERSRDSVNENIKSFTFDQIMANEKEQRDKVLKTALIAGGTAAAIASAAALPALAVVGAEKLGDLLNKIDPKAGMQQVEQYLNTPAGLKAQEYAETGIRAYSDVNAYVFSIYADQALKRYNQSGLPQEINKTISSTIGDTDVFSTYADQALKRYNQSGLPQEINKAVSSTIGDAEKIAAKKITNGINIRV